MKTFTSLTIQNAYLLLCGILLALMPSAYPSGVDSIKGCVVHKGSNDGFPVMKEYSTYEIFGSVINFTDQTGRKFRIYHGENPIIIPYASNAAATSPEAGKALAQAMEFAPQLRPKLDLIAKAWIARNAAEQAAKAKLASIPKLPTKPVIEKAEVPPLKTKSGEEFRDWNITSIREGKAVIQHADGTASILMTNLPIEVIRHNTIIKKVIDEAESKVSKFDFEGAIKIYTQLGSSEDVLRITGKLASQKEDSGNLEEALQIYSRINAKEDVARITAMIEAQEHKIRVEAKAVETLKAKQDSMFNIPLRIRKVTFISQAESQDAQFRNLKAMQESAAKSGMHIDIPSLTRIKEMELRVGTEILNNLDQGPAIVDALLVIDNKSMKEEVQVNLDRLLSKLESGQNMTQNEREQTMVEIRSNLPAGSGTASRFGLKMGIKLLDEKSKLRMFRIVLGVSRGMNVEYAREYMDEIFLGDESAGTATSLLLSYFTTGTVDKVIAAGGKLDIRQGTSELEKQILQTAIHGGMSSADFDRLAKALQASGASLTKKRVDIARAALVDTPFFSVGNMEADYIVSRERLKSLTESMNSSDKK